MVGVLPPYVSGHGAFRRIRAPHEIRPTRGYWNDHVFEAYVNQSDAIYLAGVHDTPESRPHSKISEANGWKAPVFVRQR